MSGTLNSYSNCGGTPALETFPSTLPAVGLGWGGFLAAPFLPAPRALSLGITHTGPHFVCLSPVMVGPGGGSRVTWLPDAHTRGLPVTVSQEHGGSQLLPAAGQEGPSAGPEPRGLREGHADMWESEPTDRGDSGAAAVVSRLGAHPCPRVPKHSEGQSVNGTRGDTG